MRRLLLDLDPYGGTDPLKSESSWNKIHTRASILICSVVRYLDTGANL